MELNLIRTLWGATALLAVLGLVSIPATPTFAQATDEATLEAPTTDADDELERRGEDEEGFDEIIVRAQKRAENVQDIAIAITAFDAAKMDNLGITGPHDIANYTPSMTYLNAPNRITIRGVGRLVNATGSDPGVAVYRDGVYTSEAAEIGASPYGISGITVLRGPQGTLYGRNSIGGAINITSKKPTHDPEGEARLMFGNNSRYMASIAHSGPIADNFRYRVDAYFDHQGGYLKNDAARDQWGTEVLNLSGQLEWDITENLNAWARYQYVRWNNSPGGTYGAVGLSPYNTESPGLPVGDFSGGVGDFGSLVANPELGHTAIRPIDDIHNTSRDYGGFITLRGSHQVTGHLTWDTENWEIKYIAGFNQYDWTYSGDYDGINRTEDVTANGLFFGLVPYEYTYSPQLFEDIEENKRWQSHEIQTVSHLGGRTEYIFGLYYYREKINQPYKLTAPRNTSLQNSYFTDFATWIVPSGIPNPESIFYFQQGDLKSNAYAAYGQIDFDVTDKFGLQAGLRYSRDEKQGLEQQRIVYDMQGGYQNYFNTTAFGFLAPPDPPIPGNAAIELTPPGFSDEHKDNWSAVTGSVMAKFKPNDDTMLYARFATGYKSGGFRLGGMQGIDDPSKAVVDQEELISYEVGYKTTINDTFRLNAAAYFYDYTDLQIPISVVRSNVVLTEFMNAKSARVMGFEAETEWLVTDDFSIIANYSYMDTKIRDMGVEVLDQLIEGAVASNLAGNELVKSPKHKVTVNAFYVIPTDHGDYTVGATLAHVGSQYSSVFNRDLLTKIPAYERVDLRASWTNRDQDLTIIGFMKNVFNKDIVNGIGLSSPRFNNARSASINPPRLFGIEIIKPF